MAFSNIDSLGLGDILHIVFDNAVYNQLSLDYRDFEMVQKLKITGTLPREYRYYLQSSLGPGAVAWVNPGTTGRAMPTAHAVSTSEATAKLKEINATIELEQNLFYRAMMTPQKYGKPLEIEINSKAASVKRKIASALYGDGTGVLGEISSTAIVSNDSEVTLQSANTDLGHVGLFEIDDKVVHKAAAGTAGSSVTVSSGTFDYWRVLSKDVENNKVTLQAVNTSGTDVNVSSWTATAGECFYPDNQATFPDQTSISDYGTATEVMPGLESLAAADGRTLFGIVMSGATSGSRYSAGGNPIDARHLQRGLDTTKRNVGPGMYSFKQMLMAYETQAALIESNETDKRFQVGDANSRGFKGAFQFVHGNDVLDTVVSEYCPPKRIYCIPEARGGGKVLQFVGSDIRPIKLPGGPEVHLKPGADGGFVNMATSFLQGTGILVCTHPAAIATIHNFTNS